MKCKQTQGRRLITMLKRRPMTGWQLMMTGISTAWWKRVAESLEPTEALKIVGKRHGVNLYRVVRATLWTI